MSDDLQYITRLMRIRCDKGTMDNYINVDRDHGVLAGGEIAACIKCKRPYEKKYHSLWELRIGLEPGANVSGKGL